MKMLFRRRLIYADSSSRTRLEFLRVLPRLVRYLPLFDPDVPVYTDVCALHFAVANIYYIYPDNRHIWLPCDPDPEIVRILIEELGANFEKRDNSFERRNVIQALTHNSQTEVGHLFNDYDVMDEWGARVEQATVMLERHMERRKQERIDLHMQPYGLAIAMAGHPSKGKKSGLNVFSDEILKKIALLRWPGRGGTMSVNDESIVDQMTP